MTLPPTSTRTITRDELAALYPAPKPMQPEEQAALERLIAVAKGDTGQARKAADFLLSWWNATSCGGFDMTDLWGVDAGIALDMAAVFGLVSRIRTYPNNGGLHYGNDFEQIIRAWRPKLLPDEAGA